MTDATLPILDLAGSPRERGRIHGEALRALIHTGIERWRGTLTPQAAGDVDAYLARLLAETQFVPAIERHTPGLLDEVRGIAEGAELPFATVLSYNLPDEEWWFGQRFDAGADARPRGCSVLGLRARAGATAIAGQTMDLPEQYAGTAAVLRIHAADGPTSIVLTTAGMIGLCGVNDAAVSVSVNTLITLPHSPSGLPVAFVLRGALARTSVAEARAFLTEVPHASGQNYLVAGPEEIVDLECSAAGAVEFEGNATAVCHTNDPLVADGSGKAPPPSFFVRNSGQRLAHLLAHAGAARTTSDITRILSDTDAPISQVPGNALGMATLGSIVAELNRPPRVLVAGGPPSQTPYVPVPWTPDS